MTGSINRFLDRVRAAESRQQRELVMTVVEARDLHADITRLLLKLDSRAEQSNDITIELRGQDF